MHVWRLISVLLLSTNTVGEHLLKEPKTYETERDIERDIERDSQSASFETYDAALHAMKQG